MSLVGWWKLDGNAEDSIGDYDGYEQGSVSYSDGKIGQCYDNTSDNNSGVELIRHNDMEKFEKYYSFSLWFKSTTTSGNGNVRILSRDASEYLAVTIDQNQSEPQDMNVYNGATPPSVSVNEWHHLVVTVDVGSNNSQTFLDGELVATSSTSQSEQNKPFVIGGNTEGDGDISGSHFIGKIDDVRLYDHVLSQKKVKQLSRAKVLHYKLDQDGVVADSSGQDNNGSLNSPNFTESSEIGSGAYSFNGSGDMIPTELSYNRTDLNAVTVSAWYKSSSSADQIIAASDRNEYWRLGVGSDGEDGVQWTVASSDMVSSASRSELQDGNWHHVVAVFDTRFDNDHKIYIDGELDSEASYHNSGIGSGSLSYTHIGVGSEASNFDGGTGPDDWMNGSLDDVRIYHRGLSESAVEKLYEQRASIDDKGNFFSQELDEPENKFDDFAGGVNTDTEVLGAQDGFKNVYKVDARENSTYEDFLTNRVRTSDWSDSGPGNYLYLVYWAKGNNIPDWGVSENIVYPSPSTSEYQKYVFRNDGQNSRDEYFRQFFNNSDSTSYAYIADPKIFTESEYKKRTGLKSTGTYSMDEFNEVGPASDSLVGYWPLDGDTRDYSGNGNHGTNNGASVTSGLGQSAYSFDGSSTSITVSDSSDLDVGDEITVSVWVNMNSTTGDYAGIVDNSYEPFAWYEDSGDQEVNWYLSVGGDNYSVRDISIPLNEWVHLVGTHTLGTQKAYKNGVEVRSQSTSGSLNSGNTDLKIGERVATGAIWDGKIQDVRVFNRALTEVEVKTLYNLTDPRQGQRVIQSDKGEVFTKGEFSELL